MASDSNARAASHDPAGHDHGHDHGHGHPHDHDHNHGHPHDHDHDHGHPHGHAHGHAHGHGHGHGHHHHVPTDFSRAFAIGIALNLGFLIVEAVVGWRVDSLALLADAGHNLSDVAGLVLAWAGAAAGRVSPDPRHTYGWKRAGIVAAVANAVLLLVAMGALGWEAAQRLASPEQVAVPGWPVVWVAAAGIVINGATALLFMRGSAHDLNIRGAFLHMAGDALVSAGVVASGLLAMHFGWVRLDAVASLLIAVLILASSWGLLRQSLHLLFDGVPEHIALPEVEALLRAQPGVSAVHDLHVWAMGTTETALTAHLVMPEGGADDAFLQRATQQLQTRFGIAHVTLQPVRVPFMPACQPAGPSAAPPPATWPQKA